MKTAIRVASIIVVTAIVISVIQQIAYAETMASARSEKWTCNRLTCAQFDKNYRRTGRFIVYGTTIHVTKRTGGWLTSDYNSAVARVNYIQAQFKFVKVD